MSATGKPLSIYIHIPFCIKKCLYCDFLSAPAPKEEQHRYMRALLREIEEESAVYKDRIIKTVFIGGGTPSVLCGEEILQITDTLRKHYTLDEACEISMEVNPGTVTKEKAAFWKRAGVNRISMGLQSANDKELQALGRIHNSSDFYESYRILVKTGFNNINIDLMSAIPYQTMESYRQTLRAVTELEPAPVHISAYSLIIEEETPFYDNCPELPDEDCEREMYKITDDILSDLGYVRYEISNYAKPGYECKHNQVYWKRGDYAGFGIGSASLVDNVRFHNCRDIKSYMERYEEAEKECEEATKAFRKISGAGVPDEQKSVKEEIQKLTVSEQMEEFMFLGLRMMQGISYREFSDCFGKEVDLVYPGVVDRFTAMGLLERMKEGEDERIALTRKGIDVSNYVMAEFLLS